jgi:lipopolysaccharide export LptBFGC system permease protein LptF
VIRQCPDLCAAARIWLERPALQPNQDIANPKNLMPMNLLGKAMFPRLPRWQSRRQAIQLVAALVVGVVFAAVIVTVMFFQNGHR